MPKVTIWIRVEDEAKWNAIRDKPAQIHEWLNPTHTQSERIKEAIREKADPGSFVEHDNGTIDATFSSIRHQDDITYTEPEPTA